MTSSQFTTWLEQASSVRRPLVMGVVNLTPDSFSDGGALTSVEQAVDRALELVDQGADLLDFGGESTRPGSSPVSVDEQIRRVIPTLSRVVARCPVTCSIDTTRAGVASEALKNGATLVNDISAGRDDPDLLPLVARTGAPVVLMHMQGTPLTMQRAPTYDDVVTDVCRFLVERRTVAVGCGIEPMKILFDPGIGFGKTIDQNLQLLARQSELLGLGAPLLIGTSRKGFIGSITGEADPARRTYGTAATIALAVANGAGIVRVHDVRPMKQVVDMVHAIVSARRA